MTGTRTLRLPAAGARALRLLAPAAAVVLLVLGDPAPAAAQCAPPAYHGDLPGAAGSCPQGTAGGASALVWAVVVLAAGLWLARAVSRSRAATDADLATTDAVFAEHAPDESP
ncbi:hypothetical protein ABZ896_01230 [Streptomyces sp. NPDC047072]|uniref:hypothetical protein n=1 Tax=Streptomyces sp. NPDC047072 TaxID=3154809 RepID=UPI0033D21525